MTAADDGGEAKPPGSLTVVGTGIEALSHLTLQAKGYIARSDVVFHLVTDPISDHYIHELNSSAVSLFPFYGPGKDRMESYEEMVEAILGPVRKGRNVCAVFYGHPGVFVFPSHEAITRARHEGHRARMLPAVSAEDCLFADIGFDPAIPGCQSFEATDFLIFNRKFDPCSSLILWQVGVIGVQTWEKDYASKGLDVLTEQLLLSYPADHMVAIYEAAHLPTGDARVEWVQLHDLASATVSWISTLYVPPAQSSKLDEAMLARLGINETSIARVERTINPRPGS
jgi:uncharacterized protein YabN with tetrapyrrole methylase and pyrophosphatase domain